MTQRYERGKIMEMETFATIDKNKDERYQRQKITFLEDRVKTLEKALESHAKILARYQMTEGKEPLTTEQG